MSILKTLQEMNNNQFMFQKIKYTFTKKYKDFIYKEKYIKSKENLLEYVYLNMFENIYDNKSNYYLHKSNFHENKTDYSDTEEESILYFNYNFTSIIQQIIKNPNITFKLFNRIIEKNLKIHKKLDSNNKLLEDRIFTDLSFNKIDINFILYYKNMGWSSKGISINKYISLEDIFKYPFINWNYKEILKNPNVTMEIFEIIYNLYKNDKNLDLSALSYNCNLTVEIIEKYKDIKWDWGIISSAMKNITLVNYEKYINNWDHHFLSLNIDFNIFDKYNYKNWSYTYLSFNKSLNIEVVIKYLDRDWDWYHISNNKNIKPIHINKYYYLPWNWKQISTNENINIDFINQHLDKDWDYFYLSLNSAITMEDIENNKHIKWNICGILSNPNIDKNTIKKFKNHIMICNLLDNKFLYNQNTFNRSITKDRKKRQDIIKKILNQYIIYELTLNIIKYIDYE